MSEVRKKILEFSFHFSKRSSGWNRIAMVVECESDSHLLRCLLAFTWRDNSLDLDVWLTVR